MVDYPCRRGQSVNHAPPDRRELALAAWRPDLVDFELDEICDRSDHLGDSGLSMEHLEEIGQVGQRAWLWVKCLEIEGSVTGYTLVENRARDGSGIEGQYVREDVGREANGEDV